MGNITIKLPSSPDEKFLDLLRNNIKRMAEEKNKERLDWFYEKKGIIDAISTIRVTLATKNKLRRYLKQTETYDELIQRLIDSYESLKEENNYLKQIEKENQQLIKYIESGYKREKKSLMLHPDFKIEYSYNESKVKSHENFSFGLEIDNYVRQGTPISEREGVKTIQTINILKSIREINITSDIKEIIRKKEIMLESEEDFIKTKYLIYFKILYFVINKKLDNKLKDTNLFNIDFWKELYEIKGLPLSSLEEDVNQKLKRFDLELNQLKNDIERKKWNIRWCGW